MHQIIVATLIVGSLLSATSGFPFQSTRDCHGKENTIPIYTESPKLVKKIVNASLYTSGTGNDTIHVVHLWGSPRERGIAYGKIAGDLIAPCFDAFFKRIQEEVEQAIEKVPKPLRDVVINHGINAALDLTFEFTKHYTSSYILEEMQGISEGSGIDLKTIIRMHMLPELVKAGCSMFGAWGSATPNGSLVQMRALDWDMTTPLMLCPTVTVYHPDADNGHAWASLSWMGFVGALTGMSSQKIGISEKHGDPDFGGKDSRIGNPFHFVLRDILQFDKTLDDATNRMINTRRTCSVYLAVGDGNMNRARVYEYSHSLLKVFDDMNEKGMCGDPQNIDDTVYCGVSMTCLSPQLYNLHGSLSAEKAIRDLAPIVRTGDTHIAIYDYGAMHLYVANGKPNQDFGPQEAYNRQYIRLDAAALFAESRPSL